MHLLKMLHHWFVPHAGNNHRAKSLHLTAMFSYVLLLSVFNLGMRWVHDLAPDILGFATDIRIEQLLSGTNARRHEEGLKDLTLNPVLSQAAAAKAEDMFSHNYWAHTSPSGKTPWDFIVGAGYSYTLAGENLAKNFQTSDGVVDAWMASPTHRANIVKSGYTDVGFAVVNGVLNGEETTLVVQMFGTPSTIAAAIPKVRAQEAPAAAYPQPVVAQSEVTSVPDEPAAVTDTPTPANAPSGLQNIVKGLSFDSVVTHPVINISSVTAVLAYVLAGLLIGALAVDAAITGKKRIVRLVGHNGSHILFLVAVMISALAMGRGSLL